MFICKWLLKPFQCKIEIQSLMNNTRLVTYLFDIQGLYQHIVCVKRKGKINKERKWNMEKKGGRRNYKNENEKGIEG